MNARTAAVILLGLGAGYVLYRGGRALADGGGKVARTAGAAWDTAREGLTDAGQSVGDAAWSVVSRVRDALGMRDPIAARADEAETAADRAEAELAARRAAVGAAPPTFQNRRTYQVPANELPAIRKPWGTL